MNEIEKSLYAQDDIVTLNAHGILSTSYLVKKYKISFRHAQKILEAILEDYENIYAPNPDQICIEEIEEPVTLWKNVFKP